MHYHNHSNYHYYFLLLILNSYICSQELIPIVNQYDNDIVTLKGIIKNRDVTECRYFLCNKTRNQLSTIITPEIMQYAQDTAGEIPKRLKIRSLYALHALTNTGFGLLGFSYIFPSWYIMSNNESFDYTKCQGLFKTWNCQSIVDDIKNTNGNWTTSVLNSITTLGFFVPIVYAIRDATDIVNNPWGKNDQKKSHEIYDLLLKKNVHVNTIAIKEIISKKKFNTEYMDNTIQILRCSIKTLNVQKILRLLKIDIPEEYKYPILELGDIVYYAKSIMKDNEQSIPKKHIRKSALYVLYCLGLMYTSFYIAPIIEDAIKYRKEFVDADCIMQLPYNATSCYQMSTIFDDSLPSYFHSSMNYFIPQTCGIILGTANIIKSLFALSYNKMSKDTYKFIKKISEKYKNQHF